jgi:hypothetical protein
MSIDAPRLFELALMRIAGLAVSQHVSPGSVFAADQSQVAVADVDADMPEADADLLADVIVRAVNEWAERNRLLVAENYAKGGFVPVAKPTSSAFRHIEEPTSGAAQDDGVPAWMWEMMEADYLRLSAPPALNCALRAKRVAEERGEILPSALTLAQLLVARLPDDQPRVILARQGSEALVAAFAPPSQACSHTEEQFQEAATQAQPAGVEQ